MLRLVFTAARPACAEDRQDCFLQTALRHPHEPLDVVDESGDLPFMILSTYTSAEKLDRRLIDAGRDLGAKPWKVFFTVELPLTLPGLMSGCVLVFVPSLALFFISDLLGGTSDVYVGNLVNDQLLISRDWPFAAALSVVLLLVTALVMLIYRRAGGRASDMTLM